MVLSPARPRKYVVDCGFAEEHGAPANPTQALRTFPKLKL